MDISEAEKELQIFSGQSLTSKLAKIERSIKEKNVESYSAFLNEHNVHTNALTAARLIKNMAGQIDVKIHALGILLCLPKLLLPNEIIEKVSLGAGNTGKRFDLETNLRVAEFKFIDWKGGAESIRQNSLFKDFYGLAEHDSGKSKYLYVLGEVFPRKFFESTRSLESILSKDVALKKKFRDKYPKLEEVRQYYLLPRSELVKIVDVSSWLESLE